MLAIYKSRQNKLSSASNFVVAWVAVSVSVLQYLQLLYPYLYLWLLYLCDALIVGISNANSHQQKRLARVDDDDELGLCSVLCALCTVSLPLHSGAGLCPEEQ